MRKKAMRKRPNFTMESVMTAILHDASAKMHHGILFARRLGLQTDLHSPQNNTPLQTTKRNMTQTKYFASKSLLWNFLISSGHL